MRTPTAAKTIEYGGLYGVPIELPPSSNRARSKAASARPIDWRYILETEGKEAAVSLVEDFEVVFHKPPSAKDLWRIVRPAFDNLPPGYERRVKSVVGHSVEMTRRDYSSMQAYEKALAKDAVVKHWWVVTIHCVRYNYHQSRLFRSMTGVGE